MLFFFYGIFLSRDQRERLGAFGEPIYDTVRDYITLGHRIVWAVEVDHDIEASLTGIVLEVPENSIPLLDTIETGYKRITVRTTGRREVQMYVAPN